MANPFKIAAKETPSNVEENVERVGGRVVLPTDVYDAVITMAHIRSSTSSQSQAVVVDYEINGNKFSETFWFLNGDGKNHTVNDSGAVRYTMGWNKANAISACAAGMLLDDDKLVVENKTIKLYDYKAKAEIPTEVPVIMSWLNKPICFAINQVRKYAQTKNEADGKYYDDPSKPHVELNEIAFIFDPENRLTLTEMRRGDEEPAIHNEWLEKNKGKVVDLTTKAPKLASGNTNGSKSTFTRTSSGGSSMFKRSGS